MKLLNLRDNALFVRNFRERMRTHVVGSYAAILFVIIMIFLLASKESFAKAGGENLLFAFIPYCVPGHVLAGMAVLQGFVILLLGTLSAYRMALQDRLNGTLDFFRATPTEGINHVIGLVLGAPVLEWFFFLLLIPVMLVFAILSSVNPAALMEFYASVILCAVFYHSLGVLAGVCSTQKKYRAAVSIILIGAIIVAGTGALIAIKSSTAYHSTFLPGYMKLFMEALSDSWFLNYNFYIFFRKPLPSLVFQMLVQLPLLILVYLAIKRKIASPETPILSKVQLFILTLFVLVFFTCDSAFTGELQRQIYTSKDLNQILFLYLYSVFFLSVFFSIITTPTALDYQKGLNRVKKLNLSKLGCFDEQNTNSGWVTLLCALFAIVWFVLCAQFKVSLIISAASFAVLTIFIVFFAKVFEFFRLSRFHGKVIVFSTAVLILWIALPITEIIINYTHYPFFTCFSPLVMLVFWGGIVTCPPGLFADITTIKQFISLLKLSNIGPAIKQITLKFTGSNSASLDIGAVMMVLGHITLLAVTVLFIVLAARERKRLRAGTTCIPELPDRNR